MYCRMCGNKLGETDQYCQKCGASATPVEAAGTSAENREIKEEVVFNPPYETTSPFAGAEEEPADDPVCAEPQAEDLGAFISEHDIKEANRLHIDKGESETDDVRVPEKNQEFTWNVHEFPGSKKRTENTDFNWNMEEFGQPETPPVEAAAFEQELFREMRADVDKIKEQNIDRFFTFSRKNEEFQELLDREYEKVKTRSIPDKMPRVELHIESLVPLEAVHEEDTLDTEIPVSEKTEAVEMGAAKETESVETEATVKEEAVFETETEVSVEPQPEQKTIEPANSEIIEVEPAAQESVAVEPAVQDTLAVEPPVEKTETSAPEKEAAPKADHLSEMAKARAQFFGEELVRDNDSIVKKLSNDPSEATEQEKSAESDTTGETQKQEPVQEQQQQEAAKEQEPEIERVVIPLQQDSQPKAKNRITGSQVALAVIAIILAAEIGILGIRYFAPESAASTAIENAQVKVIRTVAGWFETKKKETDQTKEEVKQDNKDQTTDEDSTPQDQTGTQEPADTPSVPTADPNPMADKNALVSSQLGYNTNIEQVKANEELVWQSGKNYGLSDINSSVPITNNIWQAPETGDPVYYDKSIVGAVIAFDSQWIDYVNNGSKSVLDLLKKDSEAYKNTLAYKKVGKIKENFKLLEVGEIRQGSKGYYVWVHEEIQITENGTTANKKYNWIYCLEPVDGKMKIVNYLKF